jgi:hypothetical protein
MAEKAILIHTAEVTITLPVVCQKCRRHGRTEPIKLVIAYVTVEQLAGAIANHPDTRIGTRFPVGWAGYGTYYHCPMCV